MPPTCSSSYACTSSSVIGLSLVRTAQSSKEKGAQQRAEPLLTDQEAKSRLSPPSCNCLPATLPFHGIYFQVMAS